MGDYRAADHAMGLELQIEELTEQRRRAEVQGRLEDAGRIAAEVAGLQSELAATAERAATEGVGRVPGPELHDAEKLAITEAPT